MLKQLKPAVAKPICTNLSVISVIKAKHTSAANISKNSPERCARAGANTLVKSETVRATCLSDPDASEVTTAGNFLIVP